MKALLWVVFGLQLSACATTTHAQIRSDASRRWGCSQSVIDIEEQGQGVLRASGCGKSLLYVCSSSPAGDTHSKPITEEEARFQGGNAGECHPR